MKAKNTLILLFLILAAVVLSTLVAELTKNVGFLQWLTYGDSIGFTLDNVNLAVVNFSFDFHIRANVLQILLISPEEVAQGMPSLDELSFFDLLEELEGVAERIDNGDVQPPLPFSFRLVGDALFGWEHADEEDFR